MNWRVYILAAAAFSVGLVELIVGGILPVIADDLGITIASAGQLITVFALVYAISAPVLISMTAKVERKKLYLWALVIFTLGNIMTFFSTSFALVMIARVITAMSTALVVVLSLTITAKIVKPEHRAKAIGLVFMGISSSLVLGVPVGIFLTEAFGWRTVFLGIALLSFLSFLLISLLLEKMPVEKVVPLRDQVKSLASVKISTAHLVTLFMLAGHYVVYAYFTPFLEEAFGLKPLWVSVAYFIIGVASIGGNAFGGIMSDKLGSKRSILTVVSAFAIVLLLLPALTGYLVVFLLFAALWGGLSWALTPAMQNYLIQSAPETSDIQQSLNTSALQLGIAMGSFIGGLVLTFTGSIYTLPMFGAMLVLVALAFAFISLRQPSTEVASQ